LDRSHRTWLTIVSLLLLSIILIVWEVHQAEHGEVTVAEQIAGSASRPVHNAISTIEGSLAKMARAKELINDAVRLETENARLNAELTRLSAIERENFRLRKLLELKEKISRHSVPARIIARDPATWTNLVIINRGKSDGIDHNFYVQNPWGIVGRVVKATKHTSLVRLLTDRRCTVPAMVLESGAQGILYGNGEKKCILKYLDSTAKIERGNKVVTSGMGNIFPPYESLGRVVKVTGDRQTMFKKAVVEPEVDFSTVSEVLVVKKN